MVEEPQEQTKGAATEEEAEAAESDTGPEIKDEGFAVSFLSPAIIMLFIAIGIDLIGVLLLVVGLDDFFITDVIGTIFIGGWMFFRSGSIGASKGITSKMGKSKWLKFLPIFEFVPYVGSLPCWTLAVFHELKKG